MFCFVNRNALRCLFIFPQLCLNDGLKIVILAGWETETQSHEKFTTLCINSEERKCQVLLAVITNGRCKILSVMCEQTAVDVRWLMKQRPLITAALSECTASAPTFPSQQKGRESYQLYIRE